MTSIRPLLALAALLLAPSVLPAQEVTIQYGDGSDRVLRVYDMRPWLKATEPQAKGPSLVLTVEPDKDQLPASGSSSLDFLARSISAFVEPPFSGPEELRSISGTHLVAVAQPKQHKWIAAFLESQTRSAKQQLRVEAQILTVPLGTSIPSSGKENAAMDLLSPSGEPVIMDRAHAKAVMRHLADRVKCDQIAAPSVLCLPNQRTSIATLSQTSYVKDYRILSLEQDGEMVEVADPIIGVVEEGILIDGAVAVLGKNRLAVNFSLSYRELLERPIKVHEVELGSTGRKVKIQLPTWSEFAIDAVAAVADGQTMQFVTQSNGRLMLFWLTVGRIS